MITFAMRMRYMMLAASLSVAPLMQSWGYDKPYTYSDSHTLIFRDTYLYSPHTWSIVQAVMLLQHDGYVAQANLARCYLLPMMEGAMFNDVWGDADLAGASILDYYCPDKPDQNYGFGSGAGSIYKNSTQDFQSHAFYGYGNAAEYAQFRYDGARRAFLGRWGGDPRDDMAGWVEDVPTGQHDPMNGKWANGTYAIDHASGFGHNQTPASALTDLLANHCRRDVIFSQYTNDVWLSSLAIPDQDVFNHAPDWLNDHFGDADSLEAYCGSDGHGSAVYANWTTDSGGDSGHAHSSPFVFYVPVNSRDHAFFLLGWALHLVADNTLMVHTIDGSLDTLHVHNDIEAFADQALMGNQGPNVRTTLPAFTNDAFQALYTWPPPTTYRPPDPADFFVPRWYSGSLQRNSGEGVAHAYVRDAALVAHNFWPYVSPDTGYIDTERDANWVYMGFFTALELDRAVKGTAGLLHRFLNDVGQLEGDLCDDVDGSLTDVGVPYEVIGNVFVPAGKTLTIGPGVTVRFDPGTKIRAVGTLVVDGTLSPVKLVATADLQRGMEIHARQLLTNGGELKLP